MDEPKFEIGAYVFAKMRGYPPWPAIIDGIHDLTPQKIKYMVYFFGTRQVGIIKEQDVFSFSEHKDTLGKPKKNSRFNISMAEAEASIKNKDGNTLLRNLQEEAAENQFSENSVPSSTENECNMDSGPFEDEIIDTVSASLIKEHRLITLTLNIQASLGVDKVNFELCLDSLNEIEALSTTAINRLMLLKNPEIVLTLTRVKNFCPTYKVERIPDSKEKFILIRFKAQRILSNIQLLFPSTNGQSLIQTYKEELEIFKDMTENYDKEELLALTEELLVARYSSTAGD